MDDVRFGIVFRTVRQRRGWRQSDVAERSGISQSAVSRIECGLVGPQSIDDVRAVAATLEIRVGLVAQWRGGDLDRLLNRRHSLLHESVARMFRDNLPAWIVTPEVSFSIFGERGVIDILAWHPGRRALLVIELKTDLADMNELVGTFDRKRRLAREVAEKRGWDPVSVSAWLVVAASRTNRRRVEAHRAMLRAALPDGRPAIHRWLRDPVGTVQGLSFWTDMPGVGTGRRSTPIRRVSAGSTAAGERGSEGEKRRSS